MRKMGYVAGIWENLVGEPHEGCSVTFRMDNNRLVSGSTATVDSEGITVSIGPDGQLSGTQTTRVGEWEVLALPASDDYLTQPVDGQIIVTENMPGGAEYRISVSSWHTAGAPLIVSSSIAELAERPGALVKPVISQNGTSIPAFAVPGRDLLLDNLTGDLYAVVPA